MTDIMEEGHGSATVTAAAPEEVQQADSPVQRYFQVMVITER